MGVEPNTQEVESWTMKFSSFSTPLICGLLHKCPQVPRSRDTRPLCPVWSRADCPGRQQQKNYNASTIRLREALANKRKPSTLPLLRCPTSLELKELFKRGIPRLSSLAVFGFKVQSAIQAESVPRSHPHVCSWADLSRITSFNDIVAEHRHD